MVGCLCADPGGQKGGISLGLAWFEIMRCGLEMRPRKRKRG